MLKRTKLSLAVSAALSAGLAGFAPGALGQTSTQSLDRVEVTGSLIKRIESEVALPVTSISATELQSAGVTNAEQVLRTITQNNAGGAVTSGSVSGNNGGASYASLRALGAQRTLVLLNGKRIVNNPNGTVAVDLNTMPTAALERVEVLQDGASSTYGTDAIAGVINYITRKQYQGVTVGGEMQIPEDGGGEIYVGSLLGGYGNLATQGWNVFGAFNYRKQQPLQGNERDFMESSYIPSKGFDGTSPTTFPGNYVQTGTINTATNPYIPGCFPPSSIRVGNNSFCSADTQLFTQVIPDQEQIFGIPARLAGAGREQHPGARVLLLAEHGDFADRTGARRRPDDAQQQPVLPGQRHHTDHQRGAQPGQPDLGRLAHDGAGPALDGDPERHAARGALARWQRDELGLLGEPAVVQREGAEPVPAGLWQPARR